MSDRNPRVNRGPTPAGAAAAAAVTRDLREASLKIVWRDWYSAFEAFQKLILQEERRPPDKKAMDPFDLDLCRYALAYSLGKGERAAGDKRHQLMLMHTEVAVSPMVRLALQQLDKMTNRGLFPSSYLQEVYVYMDLCNMRAVHAALERGREAMKKAEFPGQAPYHWPGLPDMVMLETHPDLLGNFFDMNEREMNEYKSGNVQGVIDQIYSVMGSTVLASMMLVSFKCTEGCVAKMDKLCWMALMGASDIARTSLKNIPGIQCMLRKDCKGKMSYLSLDRIEVDEIEKMKKQAAEVEIMNVKSLPTLFSKGLSDTLSEHLYEMFGETLQQKLLVLRNARSEAAQLNMTLADWQKDVSKLKNDRDKQDKEIDNLRRECDKLGNERDKLRKERDKQEKCQSSSVSAELQDLKEKYRVKTQKWNAQREQYEREKEQLRRKFQNSVPVEKFRDKLKVVQNRVQNLEEDCKVNLQMADSDKENILDEYLAMSKIVILVEAASMRQALKQDLVEIDDYRCGLNFLLGLNNLDHTVREDLVLYQRQCQRYTGQLECALQELDRQENDLLVRCTGDKADLSLKLPSLPKKPELCESLIIGQVLPLVSVVCKVPAAFSTMEHQTAIPACLATGLATVVDESKKETMCTNDKVRLTDKEPPISENRQLDPCLSLTIGAPHTHEQVREEKMLIAASQGAVPKRRPELSFQMAQADPSSPMPRAEASRLAQMEPNLFASKKKPPLDTRKPATPTGHREQFGLGTNPGKPPNMARLAKRIQTAFPVTSQLELMGHLDRLHAQHGILLSEWTISQIIKALSPLVAKSQQRAMQLHKNVTWLLPVAPTQPQKVARKKYEEECCICLMHMTPDTSTDLETCDHRFHTKCIRKWLREKSDCPYCRKHVLLPTEFPSL